MLMFSQPSSEKFLFCNIWLLTQSPTKKQYAEWLRNCSSVSPKQDINIASCPLRANDGRESRITLRLRGRKWLAVFWGRGGVMHI